MINSLFPSVFPTTNPSITANQQLPAEGTNEKTNSVSVEKTTVDRTDEGRRSHHHDHDHFGRRRWGDSERSELFHAAKHMMKDAFRDFRHDLRDSFSDLGFDGGLARKIARGVMHATRDALRSGVDFSAKLMVAAISQTSLSGATGTASAFSLVANSIEVNINHATGSIDVTTAKVSIEGQFAGLPGGDEPHLLDIQDSDQPQSSGLSGILLALQDLTRIFDGEEEEAVTDEPEITEIPAEPVVVSTARESMDGQLAQSTDESTTRTAVDTVLESAAAEEEVAADDIDETEDAAATAEETEEAVATEEAGEPAPVVPDIATPLLLNRLEYRARIFITAFERSVNDRSEEITFMRFNAIVPLSVKPTVTTEEPVSEPVDTEKPVTETPEDETLTTSA